MTVLFGNTPDAYAVGPDGKPATGVIVALYTDAGRTTAATGLTDEDGSPSDSSLPAQTGRVVGSTVTSKTNGVLSFGAPDGTARLYYNRGDGVSSVIGPRADAAYASWDGTNLKQNGQVIPISGGGGGAVTFGTDGSGLDTITIAPGSTASFGTDGSGYDTLTV